MNYKIQKYFYCPNERRMRSVVVDPLLTLEKAIEKIKFHTNDGEIKYYLPSQEAPMLPVGPLMGVYFKIKPIE